jgi:Protein of unknown function (DUF4231)
MYIYVFVGGRMTDNQIQFDGFVQSLRSLVEQQILPTYQWYQTHIRLPNILFRGAGVVVVVGSLSLPVITAAKGWPFRDAVLTAVSLAVAVLSSLSTFFRWDLAWKSRTNTASELHGLLAIWELDLKTAETAQNPREAALLATQKLFKESFSLTGSETNQFFAAVKWPEISKPQ